MAKIIRFPLKMKNGTAVRTLEDLQENFDLESVLGYFADGKLKTWLSDRYYDEKAEAVAALSADMLDLNAKLCEILEVEYHAEEAVADLEDIQRQNEKLKTLREVTADKDILDSVDLVAMNQDELCDILEKAPEKIYLCGSKFEIPIGTKNICYIGVNKPLIILETNKGVELYEESGIKFQNVKFESNINPYVTVGEKMYLEGKFQEAFPIIEKAANNGNPRAMYILARYYNDGYETVKINTNKRNEWCLKAYSYNEIFSLYGYAVWCSEKNSYEQQKIFLQIKDKVSIIAAQGDVIAQNILGFMYINGYGVAQDNTQAIYWLEKAAQQGCIPAQVCLGSIYYNWNGVTKDITKAIIWLEKAAVKGSAKAQHILGYYYYNNDVIISDRQEALDWCQRQRR